MTHEERALNCDHQCSTCADNPALKSGLLKRWPIRLSLLGAANCIPYNSDILIAADCTAFACADFQDEYIKDRLTIIICPLLEESEAFRLCEGRCCQKRKDTACADSYNRSLRRGYLNIFKYFCK